MQTKVYTIRDSQAQAAMRPVFFERDEVAIRSFKLSVTNAEDPMNNAPGDFTLYDIGTYDDEKMELSGIDPIKLMNGFEAISSRQIDRDQIAALHATIEDIKSNGASPT